MTKLEMIEHRINYLLSQYEQRKNDPTYRIQMAMLAAEHRAILAKINEKGDA